MTQFFTPCPIGKHKGVQSIEIFLMGVETRLLWLRGKFFPKGPFQTELARIPNNSSKGIWASQELLL
jgi:hypothetical protein